MQKLNLKSEHRELVGRKVKSLRSKGIVPANVYGNDIKSESLQLDRKQFEEIYKQAGETGLVELEVGKETKPVLIHEVQRHSVSGDILHVDFLQVDLKQKITANIPVEITGESPAEKSGLGTVVKQINEIEVEALPADLIEKFEIDASLLTEVDQAIKVSDLKYDKSKIEVKADMEAIVVKVEPPQKEEVIAAPVAVEGAEGEVKPEGEKLAEGGEAKPEEAPKEETKE